MTAPHSTPRAWDDVRPVRRLQSLLIVLAGLALIPAVAATVMRLFPPLDDATALVASFIAYGLIGYLLAALLIGIAVIRARRRGPLVVILLVVGALVALHVSWLAPFFVRDHRPATTPSFTVLSLNLYGGNASPGQLWAQAQRADIVILVELTPDAQRALKSLGWDQRFPYAVGDLRDEISDSAIYSRFPLGEGRLIKTSFQQWVTTATVPQIGPVTVMGIHPCNPYCGGNRWAGEHALLKTLASREMGAPLIMAGDFNAVDDHGPMQDLRRLGLRSATDVAGAGWLPTWPANRGVPPLLPIDHVMINSELTATAVRSLPIAGTDHLGLFATLAGA